MGRAGGQVVTRMADDADVYVERLNAGEDDRVVCADLTARIETLGGAGHKTAEPLARLRQVLDLEFMALSQGR